MAYLISSRKYRSLARSFADIKRGIQFLRRKIKALLYGDRKGISYAIRATIWE